MPEPTEIIKCGAGTVLLRVSLKMGKRVNKVRCNRICNRFKKQRERENIPKKGKQTRITDFFSSELDKDISIQIAEDRELLIEFFQINHQKRILSNEEITSLAQKTEAFCILGQEPTTHGFNVTGVNSGHTLIQAATDRPRAYISCHKGLNAWPVEDLCSKDVATAIIDSHDTEAGNSLFAVSTGMEG